MYKALAVCSQPGLPDVVIEITGSSKQELFQDAETRCPRPRYVTSIWYKDQMIWQELFHGWCVQDLDQM